MALDNMYSYIGDTTLVWISGTLMYVREPLVLLKQLGELNADFLFISRTTIWNRPARLIKQTSPKHTYNGTRLSYPLWMLNREDLIECLPGYVLCQEYEMSEDTHWLPGYGRFSYQGMGFRRSLP